MTAFAGDGDRRASAGSSDGGGAFQSFTEDSFVSRPVSFVNQPSPDLRPQLHDWSRRSGNAGRFVKYFVDPRRAFHRYFAFFLTCCFIPGPYFLDTAMTAYKTQICTPEYMDISSTTFATLFAFPCGMGCLSGPMASVIAKWGDASASFYSGGLTFVASVGIVVAMEHKMFGLLLFFRLIFWLGLYLLLAVQTFVVYKLFTGPELGMAMGFMIFACRLGGTAGYMMADMVLKIAGDVVSALWFSVFLVGCAALAAVIFACLRGGTTTARTIIPLLEGNGRSRAGSDGDEGFRDQLRHFTPSTWLLVLQIGLLYSTIFPFETIETDLYMSEWKIPQGYVGWYTSLGTSFGLFAWAWGLCVTTTRGLLIVSVVFWVLLILAMCILSLQDPDRQGLALLGVTFFGMAYSYLSTACWILIPGSFGTGKDCSVMAVSMAYVSMSLGMCVSNFAAGILNDAVGYTGSCLWFVLLSFAGTSTAWMLCKGYPSEVSEADGLQDLATEGVGGEVEVAMHPSFQASTVAAAAAAACEAAMLQRASAAASAASAAYRQEAAGWPVAASTSSPESRRSSMGSVLVDRTGSVLVDGEEVVVDDAVISTACYFGAGHTWSFGSNGTRVADTGGLDDRFGGAGVSGLGLGPGPGPGGSGDDASEPATVGSAVHFKIDTPPPTPPGAADEEAAVDEGLAQGLAAHPAVGASAAAGADGP